MTRIEGTRIEGTRIEGTRIEGTRIEGTRIEGTGVGWRPEIAAVLDATERLGFCEVIAESIAPSNVPAPLAELGRRGAALVPHGVRLSLGGTDPVAPQRVSHLAACAEALDAPLVSEHVAFVRAGGRDAGHLLPVPRTSEALEVLAANIARVRSEVDVPLAVEPIAALFDWPEDEFTETEFLTRLLDRTGALLLLDVANVYANARNRGQDPRAVLDAMPLDRVAYCHVAGGAVRTGDGAGLYHDTHTDPVPSAVLDLLAHLVRRCPDGIAPPVMLERDGHYPPAAEMRAELGAIAHVAGHVRPRERGGSDPVGGTDAPPRPPGGTDAPPRLPGGADAPPPPPDRTPPPPSACDRTPPPSDAPPAGVPHTPQQVRHGGAGCAGGRADDRRGGRVGPAARQAELVDALVAGGPDPEGLDPVRLAATRVALLRKRAARAAADWPLLAAALGPDWPGVFADRFAGVEPTDGLREGWDLARTLRDRGLLPPVAAGELAEREATARYDGGSAPVRRSRLARALRRMRQRP